MVSKKGLSDVVTTVLIILLVVAAVGALWVMLQPLLKSGGSAAQKATVCLTNTIEPVACVKNAGNNFTVSYRRTTDSSLVLNVSSVVVSLLQASGSVKSNTTAPKPANGATGSVLIVSDSGEAKEVTITSEFVLVDGGTQVCTSIPVQCR